MGLEAGETVDVISWHKRAGEQVEKDEELVDLEVDKAVFTVAAPQSGKLAEIVVAPGVKVKQGQILGRLE